LLRTIDKYMSTDRVYNLSMSIVQSSGCGKSRLVDKAAEERFAFPLNLRESLTQSVKTYPPADEEVREYLVPEKDTASDRDLTRRYVSFLTAMFSAAESVVSGWKLQEHSRIAKKWHSFLNEGQDFQSTGQNRRDFYRRVIESAKKLPNPIFEVEVPSSGDVEASELLGDSYSRLAAALYPGHPGPPKESSKKRCAFFIYIDEAHTLTGDPPKWNNSRSRSAYHCLGSALTYMKTLPVFTLFLSTNSKLKSLAPTTASHPSARVFGDESILFPPYTELPFDIFTEKLCERLEKKDSSSSMALKKLCSTEVLVRFGRPLLVQTL